MSTYARQTRASYPPADRCELGLCLRRAAALGEQLGAVPLVLDHCHQHGQTRGLICKSCNGVLSYVNNGRRHAYPPAELAAIADYIARCAECRASLWSLGRPAQHVDRPPEHPPFRHHVPEAAQLDQQHAGRPPAVGRFHPNDSAAS